MTTTEMTVTPDTDATSNLMSHLDLLESHAIFILREVAAECERPVLLFSGGKDSAVLLHLAVKAFQPAKLPFPVMHVDTGHNFAEVLEYRDRLVESLGVRLVVASVQESIDQGRVADPGPIRVAQPAPDDHAARRHQRTRLRCSLRRGAPGRGQARAKERVLSFRDTFGQWDPKRQRPELWQLYQAVCRPRAPSGLSLVGLDRTRHLAVHRARGHRAPSIYFAHERDVVERDGMLLAVSEWVTPGPGEEARRSPFGPHRR